MSDELATLLHRIVIRQENLELTLIALISFLHQSNSLSNAQHQELGHILSNIK